jgi:hypothetical protein
MSRFANPYVLASIPAILLWIFGSVTGPYFLIPNRGDLGEYLTYSLAVFSGYVPYVHFPVEYPPLALVPILLARAFSGGVAATTMSYLQAFLFVNCVTYLVLVGTALSAVESDCKTVRLATIAFFSVVVIMFFPLMPWRFDLFPSMLTGITFILVLKGRAAPAGVMLGLAIAAKLYPAVLLPIFAFALWQWQSKRASWVFSASAIVIAVLCFIPFFAMSPHGVMHMFVYHARRGLEIETIPSGLILLAHVRGLGSVANVSNYGAVHLASPASSVVLKLLPFAFLALFISSTIVGCRAIVRLAGHDRRARAVALSAASACVLLSFILAGKVFSPQYLIWLLPFVPALTPSVRWFFVLILFLTIAIFPFLFDLLGVFVPLAIIVLNVRNLAVAGFLVYLLLALRNRALVPSQQGANNGRDIGAKRTGSVATR